MRREAMALALTLLNERETRNSKPETRNLLPALTQFFYPSKNLDESIEIASGI
jgi:hypothetical protein